MNIECEMAKIVAWIEIDRLTLRILSLPPRSVNREILQRKLRMLMREKIERELSMDKPTQPPAHYDPSSLKYHFPKGEAA